ncbi:hypothetical protein GH714_032677 [Hevea brasiliensis]|uniref:t-SNARE coiled-coil homology domain-containing protein n=1 Tax=Hevea brasiliensis TaxID=3981 RepID=A0A6A6NDQ3_HEVBR|nr:hypothetical protein GH714_032677 [Hevea brasiliensis]
MSRSPSQAVAAGVFQINTAVAGFRRLVDAIGTAKDTPEHRRKLHNTRQRILQLVKDTSAKLKSVSESDHDINVNPSKKIEDAKLARDFQTTLQEFQKVQKLASELESTYSPSLPASSLTAASGSGEYVAPSMDQDTQPFLGTEKGIREIQEQIGQVNDIFKDLAVLVHEQGVVIDDIHSNIESSADATNQAKVQLARASKSVKSRSSWTMELEKIIQGMVKIIEIWEKKIENSEKSVQEEKKFQGFEPKLNAQVQEIVNSWSNGSEKGLLSQTRETMDFDVKEEIDVLDDAPPPLHDDERNLFRNFNLNIQSNNVLEMILTMQIVRIIRVLRMGTMEVNWDYQFKEERPMKAKLETNQKPMFISQSQRLFQN